MNFIILFIIRAASSFAASFTGAVFCNVEKRCLFLCGMGGAVGFLTYEYSLFFFEEWTATFLGAVTIALLSETAARFKKVPATIFIIPAIFTIVPGISAFRTTLAVAERNFDIALTRGIETVFCAGALAFGLLLVSAFTQLYWTK